MVWPTPQDYNEAVQNPRSALADPALQGGTAAVSIIGLPLVSSGNFASVYQFHCGASDFAVRCFLQNVQDQSDRYEKISRYIMTDDLPYTVNFEYLPKGVRVHGQWFPILKMDWVRGESLDTYVKRIVQDEDRLLKLIAAFVRMLDDLRRGGIAHGDLQHGNILVLDSGELRLVDYDGMYVPELSGLQSNELGHRNYQHPARSSKHFGAYLDNFAAWSIFSSLSCLAIDPSLLERVRGGDECLLFKHGDYKYPMHSRAFAILEGHENPQINELSRGLRTLLSFDIQDIPFLNEPFPIAEDLPPLDLTRATSSDDAELLDWREQVDIDALDGSANSALRGWYQPGTATRTGSAPWPTLDQFVLSFSNAAAFFSDLELRMARTVRIEGKIRPLISAESAVFKMTRGGQSFAVKIFLHPDEIRDQRYVELMRYMHSLEWPQNDLRKYFVYCDYLPKGVNVGGQWYPVVKTYWEEGATLTEFVASQPNYAQLESALHQFRSMVELMAKSGIVHGNIEPTNLIRGDQGLRLLDFDTMFTPNMTVPRAQAKNQKLRHPLAEPDSVATDAFSAWIIDTALVSVVRDTIMFRFATPEKMIIDCSDFEGKSPVLEFMQSSGRRDLMNRALFLKTISTIDPSLVPLLNWEGTIDQRFARDNSLPFESVSTTEVTIDGTDPSPRYLHEADFSGTAPGATSLVDAEQQNLQAIRQIENQDLKTTGVAVIVVFGGVMCLFALSTGSVVIAMCIALGMGWGIDKLWRS